MSPRALAQVGAVLVGLGSVFVGVLDCLSLVVNLAQGLDPDEAWHLFAAATMVSTGALVIRWRVGLARLALRGALAPEAQGLAAIIVSLGLWQAVQGTWLLVSVPYLVTFHPAAWEDFAMGVAQLVGGLTLLRWAGPLAALCSRRWGKT